MNATIDTTTYEAYTLRQLRAIAQGMHIKGAARMRKSVLVAAIMEAQEQETVETVEELTGVYADCIPCEEGFNLLDGVTLSAFMKSLESDHVADMGDALELGGAIGDYYITLFVGTKRAVTIPLRVHRSKFSVAPVFGTAYTAPDYYVHGTDSDIYKGTATRVMCADGVHLLKLDRNGNFIPARTTLRAWFTNIVHENAIHAIYSAHHIATPTGSARNTRWSVVLERDIEVR